MMLFMFEHHSDPVLPFPKFMRRMVKGFAGVLSLIGLSLAVGIAGYHGFEGLDWIDALLNASMILGGMGPVDALHTIAGKLFASFYAIYSGLFLIGAASLLLAPLLHRMLHTFHAARK